MKNKKKIAISFIIDFITSSDGLMGGTEKQTLETIKHLDRNHFEPILICLRQNQEISTWKQIRCPKYTLDVKSLLSIQSAYKFYYLIKLLKQHSVDVVNTVFFDATVYGVLAAKCSSVKCIISSRRDMGFWHKGYMLTVLKMINSLTDYILANSKAVKEITINKENLSPDKIEVIYNGIDAHNYCSTNLSASMRKRIGIPDSHRIVGIVANLNRRVKRVDLFIEAASFVLQNLHNTSFIILGDGKLLIIIRRFNPSTSNP